ncbi:MAG: SPFH domain-containing protein [Desulfomonilaceae bacterium]|nr:SPFH domain-containing protein [Desulfomonilaceae bacterium]
MGIWDFVKSELIDVIEWFDDTGDTLVWRFPDQDHEIKNGAKLTVREGQAAVFVNEGRVADVFGPGLYHLNTQNLPILTTLRSWKYGFESPFKAEVYFLSTRNFLDLRWGTQNPIMMRDSDFGVVRLRAFGTYGIRVIDPTAFMKEVVGTEGCFTTDEIEGQLRSMIVSAFTHMLGEAKIAALDLAANYRSIGDKARSVMEGEFEQYGLSLTKFIIENISVPPEVEKMLDVRSQMGIVGDMGRYTQFQTAQAIPEAAKSGGAGEFMGMGAGIAMGQRMAGAMASSLAEPTHGPSRTPKEGSAPAPREAGERYCSQCGNPSPSGAKFCSECGAPQQAACPQCGRPAEPGARFCQECGTNLQ